MESLAAALLVCGPLLAFLSGVPALFLKNRPVLAQQIATVTICAGSLAGLTGAAIVLVTTRTALLFFGPNPPVGAAVAAVDPLSALFLLPIFTISLCCAVYATEYWPAEKNPHTFRRLTFFFGILSASLAVLVMARSSILFLIAWEIMALSCYFALSTEDSKPEVRAAGTLYLITTHLGTLALFAMFSLLKGACGSFNFPAAGSVDGAIPLAAGIFATALFGFGLKAGLMPLHIWLPSAHAHAPSHISALMSGVLIKMGIYGLVRTFSFFSHIPLWWGAVVLITGVFSGILGVAFAIAQHDIKRLLAYHSIENIGIIAMGIGIALIGKTIDSSPLVILGMAGALLHVLNHATFKALLFFSAGSAIHATHTRQIDRMGGLGRLMPWTASCFLVGAVAISGLPPLNGFISEFLIYLGVFSEIRSGTGPAMPLLAMTAPALALIGGLAAACFVKVYGVAFLGLPRSAEAAGAGEAGWRMRAPMVLLAVVCVVIGLFPASVATVLDAALGAWQPSLVSGGSRLEDLAPFWWLTILSAVLLALITLVGVFLVGRLRSAPHAVGVTWDCGYLRPAARMQYSASSFAEMLVKLFSGMLRPHTEAPEIKKPFPDAARFASHVPETVLELLFLPFLHGVRARVGVIRRLQNGQIHLYILYVFATLVVLFAWAQLG